jgi:predicted ArsR family transcriptional regulator|tara:strand:- start:83 stop:334 length:252 start_codon:yes stop_codon:yes gene_type:complete
MTQKLILDVLEVRGQRSSTEVAEVLGCSKKLAKKALAGLNVMGKIQSKPHSRQNGWVWSLYGMDKHSLNYKIITRKWDADLTK